MATTEKKYKWAYPSDWLSEKIQNADIHELRGIAVELASGLNSDEIQDKFQSDMDADGYFMPEGEDDDDESE